MIFRALVRIPLIGELLRILNAYAYRGDARADEHFAPFYLWITAFWLQITLTTIAGLLCTPELINEYLPIEYKLTYLVQLEPGPMATSILPNLLGFGIGIYALIFGLHKMLLRDLQASYLRDTKNEKQQLGSALILNAEMAVPLLVLTITIAIGLVQQVAPALVILNFFSWLTLWLSLVFTLELVVTLFGLGENAILKTLDEVDRP
jgi:hypothetical protein